MTARTAQRERIAIVGIGCRFPGGITSPSGFWNFLCSKGNAIGDVPPERWDADALFAADPAAKGRTYARKGGFLHGIEQFDPQFFGISPREAAHIDPQQRLLLETAHEAMEDAGDRWNDPAARGGGVFVGVFIHDYQHMQFADRELLGAHTGTGTAMSIAANRISYVFDLHGPSMAVDTACSSSLVAVDLACKAIANGDCDYALAGGVNVILKPEMTIAMSKATMLSKEGSCKSFDARADGYVRGEGAAVVVLKKLSAARAAGNPIYAVICGSGVNSDGQTKGISVPSGEAQEALSRRVLHEAAISADSVDYVEAHGTGTPVGDPIEANALGRVFSSGRGADAQPVLIGSVKTNIGHLESASGVAGLIKVALCLQHGEIPPNLHFEKPNPAIEFDALRLRVVTEQLPWPKKDGPRRAVVNSFGFGGTNAHVILEEAPAQPAAASAPSGLIPQLPRIVLPVSAADPAALGALCTDYSNALAEPERAHDVLYTITQRRTPATYRAALVAQDVAELRAQLSQIAAGQRPATASFGARLEGFAGRPVFVFSGMGPQWWAMARELLEREPLFRAEVQRVDAGFAPLTGFSLMAELLADEASSRIQETHVAQSAIFAVQVGLLHLWEAWGVEPAAVMGHSVGEGAALYAAGILTLEQAILGIYHRSRLQRTTAGSGTMLAVGIDLPRAERLIAGLQDRVAIGAINAPASLTLSGDRETLEQLRAQLEAEGAFARWLKVEVPYHSPQMEPIRAELLSSLTELAPRPSRCRYYSTIDGETAPGAIGDAQYFWRNVRQTVRFADGMAAAIHDGHSCFLEIGPHPVLGAAMRECLAQHGVSGAVVASLRRGDSDFASLARSLGELYVSGASIAWDTIIPSGQVVRLPSYPWQRSRHWSESESAEQYRKGLTVGSNLRAGQQRHALLGAKLDLPAPTWLQRLRLGEHGYLQDHKVQGTAVFPGTGYLEMALQTLATEDEVDGAEANDGEFLLLSDVEIGRALYLGEADEARLQTTRIGERWTVSGCVGDEQNWVLHASGRARREKRTQPLAPLELDALLERCSQELPADYAYRLFRDVGLEYGPAFRAIEALHYGPGEALSRLELPRELGSQAEHKRAGFLFHPALLDACLHTLFGALNLNGEDADRRGNVFLPVSVRQLRVYGRPTATLYSHARLQARHEQHFMADVRVYDEHRQLIAEVIDLRCQALEQPATVAQKRRREWMLEYAWQAQALPAAATDAELTGHWLVFAPSEDHALVQAMRARGAQCTCVLPGSSASRKAGTYTVSPGAAEDIAALLTAAAAAGSLRGIVHAWGARPSAGLSPASFAGQELGVGSALHLVQALTKCLESNESEPARQPTATALWIVTERTQSVTGDEGIELPFSTLWGLQRVVANEHPQLASRIVDVDGSVASFEALCFDLAQAPDALQDDEFALRGAERYVHRLRRYLPDEASAKPADSGQPGTSRIELRVRKPGDLKSMAFVPLSQFELQAHEVEIEVAATALNFKDVMKATGLFPLRLIEGNLWSKDTLGMECAGRVVRVGEAVRNLRVGDSVMALAPRSYASHVTTHSELVVPNPGLSSAAAAAIPVAFLTAVVALQELAQLRPGERVLIHAASGGVGQAAIQVAQAIGAEIYATAGSDAKRELVRALGVQHLFDSRSLGFAERIRRQTAGEGVDVVLNSLAGDAITESLSVLRDYGRFVEIGKMDLDKDFALGLRPFTRCLSFHAIDLDRMLAQRVADCGRVLRTIHERLVAGQYRALPVHSYRSEDASEAFYEMAGAKHTGKLVVEIAPSAVQAHEEHEVRFRADASYVVSGGLGGFGLELAAWLAQHGAGNLVLLGRRGQQTPGAQQAVARLSALGARVQIEACDVANAAHVARALGAIAADYPVRGVFHAAAVLDDALIKNLDLARYRTTFDPKVRGAVNLHEQTLDLPLDYFMCFSSMASVLGNQGSANYCAANAFVDALAHHRRQRGLPALTVNWGVIADVGMAADEDFYRQNLERNGLQTIHSRHCLELLGLLLQQRRVQTTVCPIDLTTWLRFNPAGATGRLRELVEPAGKRASASSSRTAEEMALRAELDALSGAERLARAQLAVRQALSQVFRIEPERIEATRSLTALGADSLMAIEIKNRLEGIGLALSVTQLLNRNSVATLAARLLSELGYADDEHTERSGGEVELASSRWVVPTQARDNAKLRLICFPYAGGGPAVYQRWPELLPEFVEVYHVNLPGRGARTGDGTLRSIAQAADAIVPELLTLLDRPFALFGHCMGAILMYEVAHRLQSAHDLTAAHIFASGCMAPHLYNSPLVHEQDDAAFLDILRLISFSGTRALIEDAELRTALLPVLRADFRAVVEYGNGFTPRSPLRSPISGFAADNDLFAAPKAMEAWSSYTDQTYELAQLPGDHYFVESDRATVTSIVGERLARSLQLTAPSAAAHPHVRYQQPSEQTMGQPPRATSIRRIAHERSGAERPVRVWCFPPVGVLAAELRLPGAPSSELIYTPFEWRVGSGAGRARSVSEMVDHAYAATLESPQQPSLFYGHCLGAIVAYELALRLHKEGRSMPAQLIVAGTVGPHLYVAPDAHKLPDEKLFELLTVLKYPLVQRLTREPAFAEARLPEIRADLEAMASYQYLPDERLTIPITAISFRHDLWSYPLRTESWRMHSHASCEVLEWPGDHYYAFHNPARIQALVKSVLLQPLAAE